MFLKKKVNSLDPFLVEKQEQIFYIKNIKKGDIVFDVGANVGEMTLLFSRFAGISGKVHSFEPTPDTFDKLSTIINCANKTNVILNNLGVTNESGTAMLNIYKQSYASWNSMANRPLHEYGINIDEPKKIEIKATSIDDYCIKNLINKIDFLKIDVEGAELNVLKGAEKMFAEKKIKLCAFEFGQTIFDMGNTIDEFKNLFLKYNYQIGNVAKNQKIFPVDSKTLRGCFSILYAKPNK